MYIKIFFLIKKPLFLGAGEMVQTLRGCTALAKDLSSVFSTTLDSSKLPVTPSPEEHDVFWTPQEPALTQLK